MNLKKFLFIVAATSAMFILISCDSNECYHQNMQSVQLTATCTEAGKKVYTCPDCQFTYTDNITEPTGHMYKTTVVKPSCINNGYTEFVCDCGYSYRSKQTSCTGHDCTSIAIATTCTSQGYIMYKCNSCDFSYNTNFIPPNGHSLQKNVVMPSCTDEGYTEYTCTKCDYKYRNDYIKPTGHDFESTVIKTASCTENGEINFKCQCGYEYSVIDAQTGHAFTRKVTMPTLSDMGYTDFICDVCQFSFRADYRFYSDILPNGAYADNTDVIAKGIDISKHQYQKDENGNYIPLDFEKIRASGIDYVIIRIGDSKTGIDETFELSYNGARAAGLAIGAYFYTRATSVHDINLEANIVLSAISDKQFEYPIYLDLEDNEEFTSAEFLPMDFTELCIEFFTKLQRAGYYTGLYVNNEWLQNKLQTSIVLQKFDIWYARYPKDGNPAEWNQELYGQNLGMWQYSESGTVDGISTNVDLNYCYKDYPSIIKEYGFNGYDADFSFHDEEKTFLWVIWNSAVKIRSKSDYYTTDGYDASLDILGYAEYGSRFEILEVSEQYVKILYNGQEAYMTVNPKYISLTGVNQA